MVNTDERQKFTRQGLTFDDVLLIPAESDVLPADIDLHTQLTRRIRLNIPLMSAAMVPSPSNRWAIAIAREGGIGIIHKNMSIGAQAEQVDMDKRSENGVTPTPSGWPPAIRWQRPTSSWPSTASPRAHLQGRQAHRYYYQPGHEV